MTDLDAIAATIERLLPIDFEPHLSHSLREAACRQRRALAIRIARALACEVDA